MLFAIAFVFVVGGCTKRSNPIAPSSSGDEFPPDNKFSLTLYSPSSNITIGDLFDVRLVLYNVTGVSGMAVDVSFPATSVTVLGILSSTTFFPADSAISLSRTEADSGKMSFGVSYRNAATGISKSGSGLICTFKCKAKAPGAALFVIDQSTLRVTTPSGTLIDNFSTLLIENLSITIH